MISGIQDLKMYSHAGSLSPPSQCLVGRRKECGAGLYKSIDVPKSDLPGKLRQLAKNGAFFEAPVGIIVTVDRMFDRCGWGNVVAALLSCLHPVPLCNAVPHLA